MKNLLNTIGLLLFAVSLQVNALEMTDRVSDQADTNRTSQAKTAEVTDSRAVKDNSLISGSEAKQLMPYGQQLFEGGFRATQSDSMNPYYRLMPGDKISLQLWGAVNEQLVLVVDPQGNVFIPSVGPVKVEGLTNGELNGHITSEVKRIYPDKVGVYTNLQNSQTVGVYVTGAVNKPGRYIGSANDSPLYYLNQAAGIHNALGSYRHILVKRVDNTIAQIDLYDFLTKGTLPRVQFRDDDVILVTPKGSDVAVLGNVPASYRYELKDATESLSDILSRITIGFDSTHVYQRGYRNGQIESIYHALNSVNNAVLEDGDELFFSSDAKSNQIVVQLEGKFFGPSRYVLPEETRLVDLLDKVAVHGSLADTSAISLKRLSLADQQRTALLDGLRRLENAYLVTQSSTAEEAKIRAEEAQLITEFVKRASKVKPVGRLVVMQDSELANVRLQDGDVITIPEKSDSILVSGEVLISQSMVFKDGLSASDYISLAGGLTDQADSDRILVLQKTGAVRALGDVSLKPGDEILVLPKAPTKNVQLAASISQIVYQIAVAAKVALDL